MWQSREWKSSAWLGWPRLCCSQGSLQMVFLCFLSVTPHTVSLLSFRCLCSCCICPVEPFSWWHVILTSSLQLRPLYCLAHRKCVVNSVLHAQDYFQWREWGWGGLTVLTVEKSVSVQATFPQFSSLGRTFINWLIITWVLSSYCMLIAFCKFFNPYNYQEIRFCYSGWMALWPRKATVLLWSYSTSVHPCPMECAVWG